MTRGPKVTKEANSRANSVARGSMVSGTFVRWKTGRCCENVPINEAPFQYL